MLRIRIRCLFDPLLPVSGIGCFRIHLQFCDFCGYKNVGHEIFPPSLMLLLLDPVSGINIRIHNTAYDSHLAVNSFEVGKSSCRLPYSADGLHLAGGCTFFAEHTHVFLVYYCLSQLF